MISIENLFFTFSLYLNNFMIQSRVASSFVTFSKPSFKTTYSFDTFYHSFNTTLYFATFWALLIYALNQLVMAVYEPMRFCCALWIKKKARSE